MSENPPNPLEDVDPEQEARDDFENRPDDLEDVELASLVPPKPEAPTVVGHVACSECGETLDIAAGESHQEALQRHYGAGHAS